MENAILLLQSFQLFKKYRSYFSKWDVPNLELYADGSGRLRDPSDRVVFEFSNFTQMHANFERLLENDSE